MSLYEHYCLPSLINCCCGMPAIEKQRAKVVPLAVGNVLEIGMGSGLNLKHYQADQVDLVWGLEPSTGMRRSARENIQNSPVSVKWLDKPSESIPLPDACADTIVLTYTLCTIRDYTQALAEMRRVLKPGGVLLFSEHGESPDESVRRWQSRLNPWWRRIAGGCNLNRQIPSLIEQAGFQIQDLQQHYVKGPKVATYQYYGNAIA